MLRLSYVTRVGSRPIDPLKQLSPRARRLFSCNVARFAQQQLTVNEARLWKSIQSSSEVGAAHRWGSQEHETGMARLSLSDDDKKARDWFADTVKKLGCKVTVDAMGNQLAVRPGRRDSLPTCAGSHLDTQPTGGRYDGILGVCAAIEMLEVLNETNTETEYPVGVINWTNEEGARFPISMVASGVWAGKIPLEKAHNLKEVGSGDRTMRDELQRIGYLGDVAASHEAWPIAAHFELHIEQGPQLESTKKRVGIVTGVQAYSWNTITVTGQDCHTGTTGFANRQDAMLTAAKMIVASNQIARKHGGLASTGILRLQPGSVNTVPGSVSFSLDVRAAKDETVAVMEKEMKEAFAAIAAGDGSSKACAIQWTLDSPSKAVNFHEDCIESVTKSTQDMFGDEAADLSMKMVSGAGHDSVYASFRAPTSMIFVPCKDGVSHNPKEYCAPIDCATGAQILLGAVLHYDRLRMSR